MVELASQGLAGSRRVGAQGGQPDLVGAGHLSAVVFPLATGRRAAAVVGGDEQRGFAPVLRVALQVVPELVDELVGVTGRVEVGPVLAAVGKVVGVAEADVEHPGLFALEVGPGVLVCKGIEALLAKGTGRGRQQLVQQQFLRREAGARSQAHPGVHGQAAAPLVEHVWEGLPRAKHGYSAPEGRLLVQEFQHRRVGVVQWVVAVDAGVVGGPGQDFVVAGVGKTHFVGHVHQAARGAAAVELALPGHGAPQKGHQGLAPLLRRALAEVFLQGLAVGIVVLALAKQRRVGPAEHFLPTHPVEGHEHHVFGAQLGLRVGP